MCTHLGIDNGFEPFIADTAVSLDGSKEHVPINDLRDTEVEVVRQAVVRCGVSLWSLTVLT